MIIHWEKVMGMSHWRNIVQCILDKACVEEKPAIGGRYYYRDPRKGEAREKLDNNAQMNLDDRHVSSFVPPLTVTRASLDRGPEIRAGPIPSRPGKNVATASPSMEFHRRIPGRQFASCIRISWISSSCIGIPALIAVADRRKNDRIDAQTTSRDYRSLSLCTILCDILNRHDENNLARQIFLMSRCF